MTDTSLLTAIPLRAYLKQLCLGLGIVLISVFVSLQTAHAQMLTQTNRDIGKGYFLQESQQVNVPGRWHSDRRNHFLYYGKRYVCQCTFYSISEQGRFVIFQTVGNKDVMLFDAKLNQVETIKKLAPEKLSEVKWDDKTEWKVTVTQTLAEDKTKTTKLSLPHKSK